MAKYKYIVWRPDMDEAPTKPDGKVFANVIYLVGYNQRSINDYREMAEVIKKDFPEATDKELICGHVTESSYCKNFTAISLNTWIEKKDYPDWREMTRLDFYLS